MKRAIFIIANNYRRNGSIRELDSGSDKLGLGGFFRHKAGYSVFRLIEDKPREFVLEALSKFAEALDPGDLLVVYFIGHGTTKTADLLVMPANDAEARAGQAYTLLPVIDLQRQTAGLGLACVFLLDCCRCGDLGPDHIRSATEAHSRRLSADGGATRTIAIEPIFQADQPAAAGPGKIRNRQVTGDSVRFCACSEDEAADEIGDTGMGLFSTALLAVLELAFSERRRVRLDDDLQARVKAEMGRIALARNMKAFPIPWRGGNATPVLLPSGAGPVWRSKASTVTAGLLLILAVSTGTWFLSHPIAKSDPPDGTSPGGRPPVAQKGDSEIAARTAGATSGPSTGGPSTGGLSTGGPGPVSLTTVSLKAGSLQLVLVAVPAGTTGDYLLGQTDITNAEFKEFLKANPAYETTADADARMGKDPAYVYDRPRGTEPRALRTIKNWASYPGPDLPVVMVSQADAEAFCRWVQRENGGMKFTIRLPTVKEWEAADRAGGVSSRWWRDRLGVVPINADTANGQTPVKKFPANPWGLYDIEGNVAQWSADEKDGEPLTVGGSWVDPVSDDTVRSQLPGVYNDRIGFRISAVKNSPTRPE